MEDQTFNEIRIFIEANIQRDPNNQSFHEMYKLLIQQKSEYDKQKLAAEKEIVLQKSANFYQFCMANQRFQILWLLVNKNPPINFNPQINASL
jgi:hypothetical protein